MELRKQSSLEEQTYAALARAASQNQALARASVEPVVELDSRP